MVVKVKTNGLKSPAMAVGDSLRDLSDELKDIREQFNSQVPTFVG
jgi:hypothetical protein